MTKNRSKPKPKSRKAELASAVLDVSGPSTLVDVKETKQEWSEFHLSDNTIIRIKPVMIEVRRVDDTFDLQGNPVYMQKVALVTDIVKVSDTVKKKK